MYREFVEDNEKVLEELKPDTVVYTLWHLRNIFVVIFVLVWTAIVVTVSRGFNNFGEVPFQPFKFFSLIPTLMLLFPIGFFIISPIVRLFQSSRIRYIITDKRVYLISGIIGTDVQSIEYREIDKLNVNVGLLEKMRNKGTIQLTPDRSYNSGDSRYVEYGHRLIGIDRPYEVYKLLKKNMLDVVTDQQFPNEYRPSTNRGNNTNLDNNDR